jgi:hypothetical protein
MANLLLNTGKRPSISTASRPYVHHPSVDVVSQASNPLLEASYSVRAQGRLPAGNSIPESDGRFVAQALIARAQNTPTVDSIWIQGLPLDLDVSRLFGECRSTRESICGGQRFIASYVRNAACNRQGG